MERDHPFVGADGRRLGGGGLLSEHALARLDQALVPALSVQRQRVAPPRHVLPPAEIAQHIRTVGLLRQG
jgi:hypothetical protein